MNQPSPHHYAVVDLQFLAMQPSLPLGKIRLVGSILKVGAAVTLQNLAMDDNISPVLRKVLENEVSYNLLQVATVGGTLVSATGRSSFAASLLALDAQLELVNQKSGKFILALGETYALRSQMPPHSLILAVEIPFHAQLAYQYVARTPADFPLAAAAVARWPSGRTRLALAGFGPAPILVADGSQSDGLEIAARAAFEYAGDEWASAEYRREMAEILTKRCLFQLDGGN